MMVCCLPSAVLTAQFQNLGFDDAITNTVVQYAPGFFHGPTSELLPGWQINLGPFINYNSLLSGLGFGTIVSQRFSLTNFGSVVFGKFGLVLVPGYDMQTGIYSPIVLTQTGDIPSDMKSVHFLNYGSPFELQVDNALIPLTVESNVLVHGALVSSLAGDISSFAGQSVELKFTTLDTPDFGVNSLDSISLSSEPVPEPSVLVLFGVGALLLFCHFRRLKV